MAAVAVPARQRIVIPFDGHVIGEGFNSDNAERVGTGLTPDSVGDDPVAPGQDAVFRFLMVTSQASLEKTLNLGAEVDARYGLFSGGAKFDFAQSNATNMSSTYIVASCLISNALRFGKDFKPNDLAKPLIAAGDKEGFKTAFGDRYTQALRTGGELHAVVRVTSSNVTHQQTVSASLHAELNGLVAAASFKASLKTAQQDASSHTEVDIQIHQTAGVGEEIHIPGTEADSIRAIMNGFATAAHNNAAAYEAELLTYDTLALPFPPADEIEDKRRVLEDCLARRQVYWSAISDLEFAQSENASLIFDDLPPAQQLVDLQNEFRRILGDLMAHAHAVSRGTIEPTPFVATNEPALPRFKRRNATSFAVWWARKQSKDETLLRDESLLIDDIARSARSMLTVPLEQASAATMERAADKTEFLGINMGSDHLDFPRLQSIEVLPQMLDAPLRELFANGTGLDDLVGMESFSRLEKVEVSDGVLGDVRALAAVAGIRELKLWKNAIVDLSGLAGLKSLETLDLHQNRIVLLAPLQTLTSLRDLNLAENQVEDLGPLAALSQLEVLSIASNRVVSLDPLGDLPALRMLEINGREREDSPPDNLIVNARGLARSPRLASSFASIDRLRLRAFGKDGAPREAGIATRDGDSNRFEFVSDTGDSLGVIQVQGVFEWRDLTLFPAPVVGTVIRLANEEVGITCTKPDDRTTNLPVAELLRGFADPARSPGGPFASPRNFDMGPPHFYLEVEPA